MYAVIVSQTNLADVRKAIGKSEISFEKVGAFEADMFRQHCNTAANIQVDTLFLDTDSVDDAALIEGIRLYRQMRAGTRIVLIALGRDDNDPVLTGLGELGVEMITKAHNKNATSLVPTLQRLLPQQSSDTNEIEEDEASFQLERMKDRISRFAAGLQPAAGMESPDALEMDLPDLPVQERIVVQERIIGSIVIAVVGVESKVGCTHQSILIANYLASKGKTVGLIEANHSKDFSSIESAYEGVKGPVSNQVKFKINAVDYYKNGIQLDMSVILKENYDYIVLDIGNHDGSDWMNEFLRAHMQIVMGAGSEWRQKWIGQFRTAYQSINQSKWLYCIPIADDLSINDIRKDLPGTLIRRIPVHPDPYKQLKDTDAVLDQLLADYLGEKKPASSTKGILYGIIGASLLVIIILAVLLITK